MSDSKLEDALERGKRRLLSLYILRAVFTLLSLAGILLLGYLLSVEFVWWIGILTALLLGVPVCLFLWIHKDTFVPPTAFDVAETLDTKFNLKNRIGTLLSMPSAEAAEERAREAIIFSQVEERLPALDVNELFPLTIGNKEKTLGALFFAVWGFVTVLFFLHTRAPEFISEDAKNIASLVEEEKLPEEVKQELLQLAKVLDTPDASTAEVLEALQRAEDEIKNAELEAAAAKNEEVNVLESAGDNREPASEKKTPSPKPSPSSEPAETEEKKEQEKEQQAEPKNEQKSEQKSEEQKKEPSESGKSEEKSEQQGKEDSKPEQGQESKDSKGEQGEKGQSGEKGKESDKEGKKDSGEGEGSGDGQGGKGGGSQSGKDGKEGGKSEGEGSEKGSEKSEGQGKGSGGEKGDKGDEQGSNDGKDSGSEKPGKAGDSKNESGSEKGSDKGGKEGGTQGDGADNKEQDSALSRAQKAVDDLKEKKEKEAEQGSKGDKGASTGGDKKGGDQKNGKGQDKNDPSNKGKEPGKGEKAGEEPKGEGEGKGGEGEKPKESERNEPKPGETSDQSKEQERPSKGASGGMSEPGDKNAKAQDLPLDDGTEGFGETEGRRNYKETEIRGEKETLDARFTEKEGKVAENNKEAKSVTDLAEVKRARPESIKDERSQPIPLEYQDLIK